MLIVDELSEPEKRVWNAIETGMPVSLLDDGTVEERDPSNGATWGRERTIRAEVLIELLTSTQLPNGRRARAVRLRLARIEGALDLEGLTLLCPLDLEACFLDEPVRVDEARAPRLMLKDCRLPAFLARQLKTRGDLSLAGTHTQWVNLHGARIGGQLDLSGAKLTNPGEEALMGDGAQIREDVLCRGNFRAEGELRLPGAHIGGQLDLSGAKLTKPGKWALNGEGAQIREDLLCQENFRAEGEIRLLNIHISGQLDLSEAQLANPGGIAVDLERAVVAHLFLPTACKPEGVFDLTNASVRRLDDNWPQIPYEARITGFVYETLERQSSDVATGLAWLANAEEGFLPQPYEQLVTVLRRAGRDDDARSVAYTKSRRRRDYLNRTGRIWDRLLCWMAGYGYRPWRGVAWLGAFVLMGWGVFWWAKVHRHMIPLHEAGQPLPQFHAWLYSLDSVLPLINLGQKSYWAPTGLVEYWHVASVLAGWILITVVLAAVTTRFVRD